MTRAYAAAVAFLAVLVARNRPVHPFAWNPLIVPSSSRRRRWRFLGPTQGRRDRTTLRRDVLSTGYDQGVPPPRPYGPPRIPPPPSTERSPLPAMPSDLFRRMAQSQLELLANSLAVTNGGNNNISTESKVQSMILYLPQENASTGQLEFTPAVLYPDPNTERVFIASDSASGQAPTLPRVLTKLPGFSHASTLLPGYPMLSPNDQASSPGVGAVEEVLCDIRSKTAALSVPLLSGPQTVGVLLVSPVVVDSSAGGGGRGGVGEVQWTQQDREQVSRAAQSLSMALMMDEERNFLREQNTAFREGLSDSLHQVKNPIQALRTYGKILQRQIVETRQGSSDPFSSSSAAAAASAAAGGGSSVVPQLLELAERLMVQSERVVDLLGPMDALVETLDAARGGNGGAPLVLLPAARNNGTSSQSMVLWQESSSPPPSSFPHSGREGGNSTTLQTPQPDDRSANSSVARPFSPPVPLGRTAQSQGRGRRQSGNDPHPPLSSTVVGDYDTEMTFVTDVLEPVFETFGAIASECGISFEVRIDDGDDLPGVMAAPRSLQEAVSNVLDNALKYVVLPKADSPFTCNPSPRVRVRICPTLDSGSAPGGAEGRDDDVQPGVTILVEDNGPGVAEGERAHIFERGFRGERASAVEGRGIGLDISRALMGRMGGYLGLAGEEETSWDSLNGTAMKFMLFRNPRL